MDVRQLKYFLAIADAGSMTKASEQLHISQPALSKTLHQLEDELECRLFTYSGHHAVLTENGMLLKERALEITSLLDYTKKRVGNPLSAFFPETSESEMENSHSCPKSIV